MSERVLVLGGGLAGVACARELGDDGVEVTLVDRNDYHQFQPLLYQVASSQLPAEDIARPHRTIFREYPSVEVVTAQVTAADMSARSLTLADGRTLQGSHLVMAAGARPNFFGVPGAAEHAFPLYSVADAERLRLHLQGLLQAAMDDAASREPGSIDVVVVGGGPTGVETTGALAELMLALHESGRTGGAGPDHRGRPGRRLAGAVLRQGPRVRAGEADRGRRGGAAGGRGHRGPPRWGRVRRRQRHLDPDRGLGRGRVGVCGRADRRTLPRSRWSPRRPPGPHGGRLPGYLRRGRRREHSVR